MNQMAKPQRFEEVEVGDITFFCPLLGVRKQRKILFKLAGVAGVPVSALIADEVKEMTGDAGTTKGEEAIFGGVQQLLLSIGDPKTEAVYDELIEVFKDHGAQARYQDARSADGWAQPLIKDVHDTLFDQKVDLEARFLWSCLEVNYRPFFGRVQLIVKAAFQKWKEAKAAKSSSQQGVTGSSGG